MPGIHPEGNLRNIEPADNQLLIISDWFMKPVTGLQLLKFVRAEPASASVRFIISVPGSEASGEVAVKDAGADGLLIEPHSFESLLATINSVLRRDEQV